MVSYRIATEADMRAFYDGRVPYTMRGVALLVDGVCLAMIGVAFYRGITYMFSEYKPDFEPCLKRFASLRAVKLAMSMLENIPGPVYALADNERLLMRLGFVPHQDGIYAWRS